MRSLVGWLAERRDAALAEAGRLSAGGERTLDARVELENSLDDAERAQRLLDRAVTVRTEPLTYESRSPHSFFRDMISQRSDGPGRQRLERHAIEMATEIERRSIADERAARPAYEERGLTFQQRDLSRVDGAGGEFVPPLWLIDRFATGVRPTRPLARLVGPLPLPRGTDSVKIPRVTTGAATAPQTADNAAVSETDMVTTSASMPVVTIAGQIDCAQQVVDQTPGAAFDLVCLAELSADYDAQLETQLWSGTGANGQVLGLLNTVGIGTAAYTDASPTVPEMQAAAGKLAGDTSTLRRLPVTHVFMHSRRWFWINSGSDGTNNRPFVEPTGDQTPDHPDGRAGRFISLPTYMDAALPTNLGAGANEDRVVATRPTDHLLLEGAPRLRLLLSPGSGTLTARFSLHNYVAWTAGLYPTATGVLTGTGLVAPA